LIDDDLRVPAGLHVQHRPAADGRTGARRVVFVHGTMDRAAGLARVAKRLPDLDVVRYDRRGYGRSMGLAPDGSVDEQVADLLALLGPEPGLLLGHSMGGVLALAVAARHPERVAGVAVFEAPMPWAPWWADGRGPKEQRPWWHDDPGDAAEGFLRAMIGDERWDQLTEATRQARRAEGPALLADVAMLRAGPVYDATQIRVPLAVGFGSKARTRHRRASTTLHELIPGSTLVEVPEAGHDAPASHPDAVAGLLRTVLVQADLRSAHG